MGGAFGDRSFFLPASTEEEACSRIFALTGRRPDGSRGEKRALIALRDALGVNVDTSRTNDVVAAALAERLGVIWLPAHFTYRSRVTLDGLNALLEGATDAYQTRSLRILKDAQPEGLRGSEWTDFRPAQSKLEAVTRIAALTGAPKESLGPGAKERKSVLLNLADRALSQEHLDRSSKTRLGASLARALGVPWDDACYSTSETITLRGLNTVLAGAERHLGLLGSGISDALATAESEGDALAAALQVGLPSHWDGKTSVEWLHYHGLRGSRDNEWQGFYGEHQAKIVLARAFPPVPRAVKVRYGNTTFDYSLNRVWDIKVHTHVKVLSSGNRAADSEIILNDEQAVRECVDEQGLGFLVVSGAGIMDETGVFVQWQRQFKAQHGSRQSAASHSGSSRMRKSAFVPLTVEAFWVPNTPALHAAIAAGQLRVRGQGRQAPGSSGIGAPRADKFQMDMPRARHGLRVAQHVWPEPVL